MTPDEPVGSAIVPGDIVPGEIVPAEGTLELNPGRPTLAMTVENAGDRPIQVGSHFAFASANSALTFDRRAAAGHRLDIPAGTSVRFEPGVSMDITLVPLAGTRIVRGLQRTAVGEHGDGEHGDGEHGDG